MAGLRIPPKTLRRFALAGVGLLFLIFLTTLLRTAWISDDAFITYRHIDNFLHGHGLTFNPGERVQAYTHPLWMALHIPFGTITGEYFFTGMFVSIAVTVFAVIFISRKLTEDNFAIAAGILILTFSKAFTDYATSGLENPLTHLLLGLFAWIWLKRKDNQRKIFLLSFIAALAVLNRMDTALFYVPVLAVVFWQNRTWRTVSTMLKGGLIFFLWEIFSVFYYGFPFPNTAYAKLGTGITFSENLQQGIWYYADSLTRDPITVSVILISIGLTLWLGGKKEKWLMAGMVLYLFYILRIGGGFMSGRFFTGPLFVAVILLLQLSPALKDRGKQIAIAVIFIGGFLAPGNQVLSGKFYTENTVEKGPLVNAHGIADERGYYYYACGLLPATDGGPMPKHRWANHGRELSGQGPKVVVDNNMGMFGFFAGPEVYLIDQHALTDPFLARMPLDPEAEMRPGHYFRLVPEGYQATKESRINQLSDPQQRILYDKIDHVIRGNLWDFQRFKEIIKLNLGYYQPD